MLFSQHLCYKILKLLQFPYDNNLNFGVQALLLPTITRSFDNYEFVIKLICAICNVLAYDELPFTVPIPKGLRLVAANDLIGVLNEKALKDFNHHKEIERLQKK